MYLLDGLQNQGLTSWDICLFVYLTTLKPMPQMLSDTPTVGICLP